VWDRYWIAPKAGDSAETDRLNCFFHNYSQPLRLPLMISCVFVFHVLVAVVVVVFPKNFIFTKDIWLCGSRPFPFFFCSENYTRILISLLCLSCTVDLLDLVLQELILFRLVQVRRSEPNIYVPKINELSSFLLNQ